jgi:hypothetical protein
MSEKGVDNAAFEPEEGLRRKSSRLHPFTSREAKF